MNGHPPSNARVKHILLVVGSLRKGSYNRQLANEIERMLENRAEVSRLDFSQLPLLNEDLEPDATPEVRHARAEVARADALWIVSPEYNHSIPGGLKNLIDWLSRPKETGNKHPLDGKPVALSGAGMEAAAGFGLAELAKVVDFVGFNPIKATPVGVHISRKMAETGTLEMSAEEHALISAQADALLAALEEGGVEEALEERPKSDEIQASS